MIDPDAHYLTLAARLAVRAAGDVEPNPLVGAVIVKDGRILGMGHHRRFGGPHAEIEALESARRQGAAAEIPGATMYITLEPCAHHGKTPPCTDAIIEAKIATVIVAAADPHRHARGGADILRSAGPDVRFSSASPLALAISRPFIKRTTTGLPWVIAKWAQTIDGRIATRSGESQWISGPAARRRVHRLRARVDAIITGLGTVLKDDPLLTARDARRIRRIARRVVVDPHLEIPADAALVRSASQGPCTIVCSREAIAQVESEAKRRVLAEAGVEVLPLPPGPGGLGLEHLLRHLVQHHQATNVLVESGPILLGSLLESDLVDEACVYIAPLILGDEQAIPAASGRCAQRLAAAKTFTLMGTKRSGVDLELTFVRNSAPHER